MKNINKMFPGFDGMANGPLLRELAKASLGFYGIFLLLYLATMQWHGGWLLDLHQFVVGRDFLNFWMAGKLSLASNPASYYQASHFMEILHQAISPDYWPSQLSYPPTQFLFALPFGLLPYSIAYMLWLALGIGALYFSTRGLVAPSLFWLLLLSPAGLICLICGQSSFLSAALIITAFRLRETRPLRAGACIGLLLIKPQLALLFPIYLLATKQWRVFAAAAATVCILILLTVLWLGTAPWLAYWQFGIPQQSLSFIYTTDMVASLTPTIFNDLRLIGVGPQAALAWQAMQSCLAIGCLLFGLLRCRELTPSLQQLLFLSCSLLATFYLMSYDLLAFDFALLCVVATLPLDRRARILFAACFWLPLLDFFLNAYGIPGPSVLPVLLVGWILSLRFLPQQGDPVAHHQP